MTEKVLYPFHETSTIPKDPVLLFECNVLRIMEFDGASLPHKFSFQLLNTLETMKSNAAMSSKFPETLQGDKIEELLRTAKFSGSNSDTSTLVKTKELLNFIEKLDTDQTKEYLQAWRVDEFITPPAVWCLETEVNPKSLSRESFVEAHAHLEGETHISDYRVLLLNGGCVDYIARSNILETGFKALIPPRFTDAWPSA